MALPSGIYTIENVKYRNWAMLLNANEGEVVAGSSTSANVGEKVRTLYMWIQQQHLTEFSSGASIDWQTRLILCRINSTAAIMQVILIPRRIRRQFLAFGTIHCHPSNGASIPPIEVMCMFCKSLLDDYLLRSSSGYLIWTAIVVGVYRVPISKPRYCCSRWCSSKWKLKHRFSSGWARWI